MGMGAMMTSNCETRYSCRLYLPVEARDCVFRVPFGQMGTAARRRTGIDRAVRPAVCTCHSMRAGALVVQFVFVVHESRIDGGDHQLDLVRAATQLRIATSKGVPGMPRSHYSYSCYA
jgi:hypothetical protein